jgi:hypothetical protein
VSSESLRPERKRQRRWGSSTCLFCGGVVRQGMGYVQIEARNYMRFAPVPLRFIGWRYAHKGCWKKADPQ